MFNIPQNILLFLSAFGTFQGCLLAAILYFHTKSDRSVNFFLALYIFFISIPSVVLVWQYFFSWEVIIFVQPFLLLIGPLLYLYIRSFREVITWKKAGPHFILFLVYIFISFWFYREAGIKYPAAHTVPKEIPQHPLYYIPVIIRSLQRILYYFLCRKELGAYQRSIRHLFSETSRIDLRWVRWLINGYLILIVSIICLNLLIFRYPEYYDLLVLIIGVMVTIYIHVAAIRGIFQPSIWQVHTEINKEALITEMEEVERTTEKSGLENSKQRKAGLSEAKLEELIVRINELIQGQRLYREPELTLQHLADRLQHPSYLVSQAINEGMKKSFYDLVNGYRVEEAKQLLLDSKNKNFTILSIGFEAGFNSKTTFNTVFKKFTGVTPTNFRDR